MHQYGSLEQQESAIRAAAALRDAASRIQPPAPVPVAETMETTEQEPAPTPDVPQPVPGARQERRAEVARERQGLGAYAETGTKREREDGDEGEPASKRATVGGVYGPSDPIGDAPTEADADG